MVLAVAHAAGHDGWNIRRRCVVHGQATGVRWCIANPSRGPSRRSTRITDMTPELLLVLLSWTQHLSGYPMQTVPPVYYRPHSFFVENACYGKQCRVQGWYNDTGIVYIDEAFKTDDSAFVSSLVVHEFTHYLQHKSGDWNDVSCSSRVVREREAYYVQNRYILTMHDQSIRIAPKKVWCNG